MSEYIHEWFPRRFGMWGTWMWGEETFQFGKLATIVHFKWHWGGVAYL